MLKRKKERRRKRKRPQRMFFNTTLPNVNPAFSFLQWMFTILSYIGWLIVQYPVELLYLNGPSFNGYGFYEGKSAEIICFELTQVPSTHWNENPVECQDLIQRKTYAFLIFIYFALYVIFLSLTLSIIYAQCIRRVLTRKKTH